MWATSEKYPNNAFEPIAGVELCFVRVCRTYAENRQYVLNRHQCVIFLGTNDARAHARWFERPEKSKPLKPNVVGELGESIAFVQKKLARCKAGRDEHRGKQVR